MEDCIFCKIIKGQIPGDIIYEDDKIIAFNDVNPQAPVHFLVIPREHIGSANDIGKDNSHIINHIFTIIAKLARERNIDKDGYRIVNNCGEYGGQTVPHLHFHVLGNRKFSWPPG